MSDQQRCACNDRALADCPGEWEPGCDLGNNPANVRVASRETSVAVDSALGLWVCPWDICNTKQAQECRASMGKTKRTRGCGNYFAPGTTLEQARKQIGRPALAVPVPQLAAADRPIEAADCITPKDAPEATPVVPQEPTP